LRTRGYVTWMVCVCARVYDGDVEDASASGEAERWSGDATMMEKIGSRRPSSSSSSSSSVVVVVVLMVVEVECTRMGATWARSTSSSSSSGGVSYPSSAPASRRGRRRSGSFGDAVLGDDTVGDVGCDLCDTTAYSGRRSSGAGVPKKSPQSLTLTPLTKAPKALVCADDASL